MIKVITLNRKRIGTSLILIGLMFILIVCEKNFDGRLKITALMQNNINALKEYYMLDKTYVYKLPQEWKTRSREFSGNEIIYHNEFSSEDNTIYGLVQVWNMKTSLQDFLNKSKEISSEQNTIKNYKVNQININGKKSYEVIYSLVDGKQNVYNCYEYFIPKPSGFVRFSFFVNKQNFKDNMPTVFQTIVKTLKDMHGQ